jgi:hypothetical protein
LCRYCISCKRRDWLCAAQQLCSLCELITFQLRYFLCC